MAYRSMTPRVFPLDPARRYDVTIRLGSRTMQFHASPLDPSRTRWDIEGLGEVEAAIDEIHLDDEYVLEVRALVTAHLKIKPAASEASSSANADADRASLEERIRLWAARPKSIVHKIIAQVVAFPGGLVRHDLVRRVQQFTTSRNPPGAIASLMTSQGNAYGRALIDDGGIVSIHPDVRDEVARHKWTR